MIIKQALQRQMNIDDLIAKATPGIFPTGRFAHLVDAALTPPNAAAAWEKYCHMLGAEQPNSGEARVFPLVAENLKKAGVKEQYSQLTLARRKTVAQNELILRAAAQVKDIFEHHGIDVVFTKGMALQIAEYRDPALRTFSDIDCCIRVADIDRVAELAAQNGWNNFSNLVPQNRHIIEAHAEMTFQLPSGVSLDIHWVPRRVFAFCPSLVEAFFASTEEVEWRGTTWRVPSADWRLLETIDHGVRANEVAPIRWVLDAIRLLENPANQFDWDFISDAAHTARIGLVFAAALTAIAPFHKSVTKENIARFDHPAGLLPRLEIKARMTPIRSSRNRLWIEFLHYFMLAPGHLGKRIMRFPSFLIKGAGRSRTTSDLFARVLLHRKSR